MTDRKAPDVEAPTDPVLIEVNGRVTEPHKHCAEDAKNTNHILITLYDNITPEQHRDLEVEHVRFQEDLGSFTYLCCYKPDDLKPLRNFKWVRQVDVYRNIYKIPKDLLFLIDTLKKSPENIDEINIPINVMPHHDHVDDAGLKELTDEITKIKGIGVDSLDVLTGKVQVEAKIEQIEEIAKIGVVRVIEEVITPCLADGHANNIVFDPLGTPHMRDFHGDNQTIAVIDSGFDLGTPDNCHPAFEGRIKKLISLNRDKEDIPTDAGRYDDPDGHGTHVCGTIVGQPTETSDGLISGVAPKAKLVVSSALKLNDERKLVLGRIEDIYKAFEMPYLEHGARIFSNSWGDDSPPYLQRQYGQDAAEIDRFVRNHPDALVVFSAGNNNRGLRNGKIAPTIGSQAAAKNCITVGASGSTRAVSGRDNKTGLRALDADKVYPDSSRGRTREARIKPDIVAPGFGILSAQSRHAAKKFKSYEVTNQGPNGSVTWEARSGTSHATPLVAGCAAVLRQIFQQTPGESPPAALIKAVLINGADKLPNVDVDAQGFGRVNLLASADMAQQRPLIASKIGSGFEISQNSGTLIGNALVQDDTFEMTMVLDEKRQSADMLLKVTLVYNDAPGREVQNNLNLDVLDAATGNTFHGYDSVDDIAVQNNVEQVVLPLGSERHFKIRVVAQKVFPKESQDFVLAWAILKPYSGLKRV
ncbi:peptidase s8 and s53 [Fusarium longipes]|uniref:Peptidase s8 and s53 n=1 Tax=Fusarium longipes TaxID=694270 RepID=A0A395RYQ2_9HYPO|nr:peptidase s8 and s53 [Fusarium longipes]